MEQSITITKVVTNDVRFPTSDLLDGSDAMNPDPDYSAAYVILETNHPTLEGHGLTFTIGRGNELCVSAIESLSHLIVGKTLESFTQNMGEFWKMITGDSQLRWLGPKKGVIHLATGAIVNAVWDLYAKTEGKPLWKLISDMSPKEFVKCIDFTYITDAITPDETLQILKKNEDTKQDRIEDLIKNGYPAYTTSAGWLGYSDDKMRRLCQEAKADGFKHMKIKVGSDLQDDMRRAQIIREEIGDDLQLMMDANQKWGVDEAIKNTNSEDLDELYNVNIKGVYNGMKASIPHFKKHNNGVIINMAPIASSVGISDRFAYSMTKGAVLTMTYSVAKDYLDSGIRCNCISLARVHTPFVDGFIKQNYPDNQEEMFKKLSETQPIGRMG